MYTTVLLASALTLLKEEHKKLITVVIKQNLVAEGQEPKETLFYSTDFLYLLNIMQYAKL